MAVPSDLVQIRGPEQGAWPANPVGGPFLGVQVKMLLHIIREATQISFPKKDHRGKSWSQGLSFLICNVGKIPMILDESRTAV